MKFWWSCKRFSFK